MYIIRFFIVEYITNLFLIYIGLRNLLYKKLDISTKEIFLDYLLLFLILTSPGIPFIGKLLGICILFTILILSSISFFFILATIIRNKNIVDSVLLLVDDIKEKFYEYNKEFE